MMRMNTNAADKGLAVTTTLVRGCLIVTFPAEVAGGLELAQKNALDGVQRASAHTAVLELSAVKFLDRTEFEGLRTLSAMLFLLGARCIIVGLRPGVVAWLVSNDVIVDGLEFAHDLESALERLGLVENGPEQDT
jgi:anti-anti-sigma regulatory factor